MPLYAVLLFSEDHFESDAQLFAQAMHIASRAATSMRRLGPGHFAVPRQSRGQFVSIRCGPTHLILCVYGLIALPFLSSGLSSSETPKNVLVGVENGNSSSSTTADIAVAKEGSRFTTSDALSTIFFLLSAIAFLFAVTILDLFTAVVPSFTVFTCTCAAGSYLLFRA